MRIFSPNRPAIDAGVNARRTRVLGLPRLSAGAQWRTEAMRSYSQPLLLWFTRGQGRITIAGVTQGFGPHHAVFLPPGTMHGYEMLGQVYGSAVYLPNDKSLRLPEEPLHMRFRETYQQTELNALIDNILRELEHDRPGQERALIAHAGLLAVWLDREIDRGHLHDLHPDASRRLASAYSSLVEREYKSGKTVHDYAAALGVTPTHLTRACKISCGRPASVLLADRIHYEARRLLTETRRPVKDIAEELGFASAAYFTRAFQKQTGMTPSRFRQSV